MIMTIKEDVESDMERWTRLLEEQEKLSNDMMAEAMLHLYTTLSEISLDNSKRGSKLWI